MPSRYDESILKSLRRISRAIDVHSRKLANTYNLTAPQLVCLREIHVQGPLSPSTLSVAVSLSQPTVTGILDRLEKRTLIKRVRQTTDKRRVNIELTPTGLELVTRAPIPLHEKFAERLSALDEAEQRRIHLVLEEIVDMMEAEHLDASPVLGAGPVDVAPGDVRDFLDTDKS